MSYTNEFAQRLVMLREDKGLTQQQLADILGVTRQSLSLYEKAERTINIDLLAKIADEFEVTTDFLLGRSNAKTLDTNIQSICKHTGLSSEAVRGITSFHWFTFGDISIINYLFEEIAVAFDNWDNGYEIPLLLTISRFFELCNSKENNQNFYISRSGKLIDDNNPSFSDTDYEFEDVFAVEKFKVADIVEKVIVDDLIKQLKIAKDNYNNSADQYTKKPTKNPNSKQACTNYPKGN